MKTCRRCRGPLERRQVDHLHRWGGKRLLIQHVNAEVCARCGETYLSPKTLRAIDAACDARAAAALKKEKT